MHKHNCCCTLQTSPQYPLTLLCQDHPKMGDSMTCHNFACRIAKKWAILCFLLETCWLWHANCHGGAGLFSLNHKKKKFHNTNYRLIELPKNGWFYALAQKGLIKDLFLPRVLTLWDIWEDLTPRDLHELHIRNTISPCGSYYKSELKLGHFNTQNSLEY
jgi:hypothetical protein